MSLNKGYKIGSEKATPKEKVVLRELASEVMEIAHHPSMQERKEAWRFSNDLQAKRPVILIETIAIKGFKDETKLVCEDPYLRDVEKALREMIRHYIEINDDFVVEPYYRIPWKIKGTGFGVDLGERHAVDKNGDDIAYTYDHPIKIPEDISKLRHNEFTVFREDTRILVQKVSEAIGDIMPVRPEGVDAIFTEWEGIFSLNADSRNPDGSRRYVGYTPFIGAYFVGVCMSMYKLLGNNNLIYWSYDNPELVKEIAEFVAEDRAKYLDWLEQENLLASNTDNQIIGSGPYGYVTSLAEQVSGKKNCSLKDIWGWAEAQEAGLFSPEMFKEFFLPYLAKVANKFGLITYGCCERIDDRIQYVIERIRNIRSVAVSPWNDDNILAEILGKNYTYCRKIVPSYLAVETVEWEPMKKEIETIYGAAKNCNLQIVIRDLYGVNGDFARLSKWADMTRAIIGI